MKRVRRPDSTTVEVENAEESQQDDAFRKLVGLDVSVPDSKEHSGPPALQRRRGTAFTSTVGRRRQVRVFIQIGLMALLVLVLRTTSTVFRQSSSATSEQTVDSLTHATAPRSSANATIPLVPARQLSTLRLGSRVPKTLRNGLADMSTPYNQKLETPYFWDVHFAGETVAENVFRKCHFLIQACEHGLKQPHYNEDKLEAFEAPNGALYVNVDTTTLTGMQRAQHLELARKHMADVVMSPRLHDLVGSVFAPPSTARVTDSNQLHHKGRLFALFRHPVDRAITMYYYLATASWDPMYNPKLKDMTLEEYAASGSIENNWMTRFLVNKPGGKLTKQDMLAAKETLRTKCLVGLYEDMEASLERFSKYFGWSKEDATVDRCRSAVVGAGDHRLNHPPIKRYGVEWNGIVAANEYDCELYEYAKILYHHQGEQIFGIEYSDG